MCAPLEIVEHSCPGAQCMSEFCFADRSCLGSNRVSNRSTLQRRRSLGHYYRELPPTLQAMPIRWSTQPTWVPTDSHPILTWGNGTNATPSQYTGVLSQLASWGFVIIASNSTATGTGNEMLAGAQDMVNLNSDPTSLFYDKLNTNEIGAIGHSQGAGGSVRATVNSNGLIKVDVPICLPAQIWISTPTDAYNPAQLTVPVLFLGGSNDFFIASPQTLKGYYNEVPGAAALLVLNGADHNTIQGSGGHYLGYLTAWLMYQLQGDQYARGAFVGNPPEANTNSNWSHQAEKNLPQRGKMAIQAGFRDGTAWIASMGNAEMLPGYLHGANKEMGNR